MKFIHTSDWHIGKTIHEVNLLEDQKLALRRFMEIIEEEKPDVILIAGDLYDRAVPSKEAVNALDEVLSQLIMDYKIPVLCVAGNHDSGERLEFTNRILEKNNLHIEGKLKKDMKKIQFEDAFGKINFYLIPFAYVTEVMGLFEGEEIKSFDDAFKAITSRIQGTMNKAERNVLITHGFIVADGEAMEVDESVRPISIGTTEYVNANYFKDFDYTALGHLHQAQKVKWEHLRYSGSLMKYAFSEAHHQKGVSVIEMGEKGTLTHRFVPIEPVKNMVKLEGSLRELLEREPISDYVMAILTDENPLYDAIGQLRAVYPNILRMEYKSRMSENKEVIGLELPRNNTKSDVELFEAFYVDMTGKAFDEEKRTIVEALFEELLIHGGDFR